MTGHLPKELHDQASAVLRAAWKLGAKDGKARIEQFASWVQKQHPDAAGSLREGLDELFTVRGIGLTPVERWVDGGALGRRLVPGRREGLP